MVTFDDNLLAHVESPWRPEWASDWDGWEVSTGEAIVMAALSPEDRHDLFLQAMEIAGCLGSWCNG
jgi:hypothetical protein